MSKKRAIVDSVTSNFYVNDYLNPFGKNDRTEEHVVGLAELLKGNFHLTKWMRDASIVPDTIWANKPSEIIRHLNASTKNRTDSRSATRRRT